MTCKFVMILGVVVALLPAVLHAQDMPTPAPAVAEVVPYLSVNEAGVQFSFDSRLASGVSVATYPTTLDYDPVPSAAFTEFTFDDYLPGDYLSYAPMPRVDVFTVEEFGQLPIFAEQLDALNQLLVERPDLNQYVVASTGEPGVSTLPFLPPFHAGQIFRAHPDYIEVANVRGIRYLVYYAQAPNAIIEGEVFYTFQGITADGQHYISVLLPINTGVIPPEADAPVIDMNDPDGFAAAHQDYIMDVLGLITAANTESFSPAMTTRDELAQSIEMSR